MKYYFFLRMSGDPKNHIDPLTLAEIPNQDIFTSIEELIKLSRDSVNEYNLQNWYIVNGNVKRKLNGFVVLENLSYIKIEDNKELIKKIRMTSLLG